MKRYAVAHINFWNHELTIKFVWAISVRDAILVYYAEEKDADILTWITTLPNDLSDIKVEFFNCDQMIDVVEVSY